MQPTKHGREHERAAGGGQRAARRTVLDQVLDHELIGPVFELLGLDLPRVGHPARRLAPNNRVPARMPHVCAQATRCSGQHARTSLSQASAHLRGAMLLRPPTDLRPFGAMLLRPPTDLRPLGAIDLRPLGAIDLRPALRGITLSRLFGSIPSSALALRLDIAR